MTKETKHLIYWQIEWLKRFFRTTYHIFNRKAYRNWKNNKYNRKYGFHGGMFFDAIMEDEH